MEYAAFKTEENSSTRDLRRSVKAEVMAILVRYFGFARDMEFTGEVCEIRVGSGEDGIFALGVRCRSVRRCG